MILFFSKIAYFFRAESLAISLFDRSGTNKASLKKLRYGIDISKKAKDKSSWRKYSEVALANYPSNSLGYIELAGIAIDDGNLDNAHALLLTAPRTKQINSLLAGVQRKIKNKTQTQTLASEKEIELNSDNEGRQYVNEPIAGQNSTLGLQSSIHRIQDGALVNAIDGQMSEPEIEEQENIEVEDVSDRETLRSMLVKSTIELQNNILSWKNYDIQARILLALGNSEHALILLKRIPKFIVPGDAYYVLLAKVYKQSRDFNGMLQALKMLHKNAPSNHSYILKISEVYRDDANLPAAYIYIQAARLIRPKYGAIRQLTFETDNLLIDQAKETLAAVGDFDPADFVKFLPMLNRVSVFFPEMRDKFAEWRNVAHAQLLKTAYRSEADVNNALTWMIKFRRIDDAKKLILEAGKKNLKVNKDLIAWNFRVEQDLGRISDLVEMARLNEESSKIIGYSAGYAVDVSTIDLNKVVEVFIPTAFFSDGEDDKPSFVTVRNFLRVVYNYLLSRDDLIIVPRHQFNWRYAERRLPTAKAISYHTSSAVIDPQWMHVQEATLAGRCTFDLQGFAGFSSIASHHAIISDYILDVPDEVLEENYQEVFRNYAQANISKYEQSTDNVKIEGRYVFVALQVATDIVASLAYVKGIDLLCTLANHYAGTDVKVVVKRHPYCSSISVESTINDLVTSEKIISSSASIHGLIEGAEAVYVVNSGVGLEALLHAKPVYVTGACDYSYAVAGTFENVSDLERHLKSESVSVDRRKILEFMYFYIKEQSGMSNDNLWIENKLKLWLEN